MKVEYLIFVVLSAFLHASYNYLMKTRSGSPFFLNWVFIGASLLSFITVLLGRGYTNVPWHSIPYIYGASLFYTLYQVFVNKSYRHGNISVNYPLSVLSPLFIPIWAFFFLSERISPVTGMGITVTVAGAIAVQMSEFSLGEFKKIAKIKGTSSGAPFAIAASFAYSFGAVFDKSRVGAFSISSYLVIIIGFMTLNMIAYTALSKGSAGLGYIRTNWKTVAVGSVLVYFSFFIFRLALPHIHVSVAVPLRLVSIVFAILFGVVLLKERMGPGKVAATLLIITGLLLVNLGL